MLNNKTKTEIKKCSRCALCLQNCPIYSVVKNENNTPRGLICKLSGFEKGELSENEIKKDFKICLMCAKCKSNCPSKINTIEIFSYKNALLNPSKVNQAFVLAVKLLPIKILYILNSFKKLFKRKANGSNSSKEKVYFKGCVALAQHKTTFLDNVFYNPQFACCGLPYLTTGDIKEYEKVKKKNTELIKKAKTVVFDCATCKMAVSEYDTLDENDKKKLKFFTDLNKQKYKLKNSSKYKNKTVTFHKPCHMDLADFNKIEEILLNIENLNYKRLPDIDSCCGFGGSYFVFHPVISAKIALKKAKAIKEISADLILTACPSCTLGLRFNQLVSFNFKKTLEIRDFINSELEII